MPKSAQGLLILIGILIFIAYTIISAIFKTIADNIIVIIIVALSVLFVFVVYKVYSKMYFKSEKFKDIKESISEHTNNCNELNQYIEELKGSYVNIESYNYGTGKMIDNSMYNFQRREWSKVIRSNKVHHCSSTVCKNASSQPIKYLCKYFDIDNNEESLSKFEKVLNDFTSVEQGKDSIKRERESILSSISKSIPFLIQKFSKEKLIRELGFETVDISDAYIPTFTFQYVSAGGNSSSRCDIKLNIENLNHLINYLNDAIKWTKSIAGQRALMTSQLREKIKKRDNYRCCYCNLGLEDGSSSILVQGEVFQKRLKIST